MMRREFCYSSLKVLIVGKEWEDHVCQLLLMKPAVVVQEAVPMLEEHGCHVKKELKSELY